MLLTEILTKVLISIIISKLLVSILISKVTINNSCPNFCGIEDFHDFTQSVDIIEVARDRKLAVYFRTFLMLIVKGCYTQGRTLSKPRTSRTRTTWNTNRIKTWTLRVTESSDAQGRLLPAEAWFYNRI